MRQILVVDDEAFNREIFEKIFEAMGFHVQTAESWEKGSRLYASGAFDLVCLDVVMPGTDGFEIARAIRGIDPGQKVVMMTGLGRDTAEMRAAANGVVVDDYIFKPFTFEDVQSVVHRTLGMEPVSETGAG